ncbi:hypothetical protein [Klenkia brasiliensis]|uniref:DNA-directed RNA polymerase specialized sigma subunit, sigma24 family n=1 Tax=Klenkia brasiliensis TaxID=333142 RepID=A0A1G7SQX2_9ACTN|nr:hypothetical protein [Klenkia brasiliensis]SDG25282.1 hypothetical protein SAMN05660324_2123 [Klenkia brasiliensis]
MGTREDVARQRWRDLLPTAFLLAGDQASARELTTRTLADRRARAEHDALVDLLVLRHRRRRWSGRASLRGETAGPWWASGADLADAADLADRLDALDPDARAAVVLRWYEDRSPARVAELLPGTDPDALAAQLPGDLPRRLDVLAGLCGAGSWDDDQVADAVRSVAGRRTRRAGLAVAAAAALVAGAVLAPGPAPRGTGPTASPTRAAPPAGGVAAVAPRGALVTDAELVAGLQRRLGAADLPGADYLPLFVDDVEGVRVALMAPTSPSGLLAWLTGPAGADPADLDVVGNGDRPSAPAVAVVVPGEGARPARVVVLAEAGAGVTISAGVVVDPATGAVRPAVLDVPAPDGVAAVTLDRPDGYAVRVVVTPLGAATRDVVPATPGLLFFPVGPGPDLPSRSGLPVATAGAAGATLSVITAATGWAEDDLDVRVLGSGLLPAPDGSTYEVVSVGAVLPSGAVVTATGVHRSVTVADGTTTTWSSCGGSAYPAGTDLEELVVAATCSVRSDLASGAERTTVVFAPRDEDVVLDTGAGDPPVTAELVDGFGWTAELRSQDFRTATTPDGAVAPVAGPTNDALRY